MPPPLSQRALGYVLVSAARKGGYLRSSGSTTSGTTTSLTSARGERTPLTEDTSVLSTYLYLYDGTGSGQSREITTYGTVGVFGWTEAGTAPDSTTLWARLSIDPADLLAHAQDIVREMALVMALQYKTTSLVTNNLLDYFGDFEEWTAGAAAAPDGWVLGGVGATVARESSTIGRGRYSVALTAGAGGVATLTRTIPFERIRKLDNTQVLLKGLMAETSAGDGRVRVITKAKGVAAVNTDRIGTYTGNEFEELEDISTTSISLPNNLISLQVQLRANAGTTVYFDNIILGGPMIRDYRIPDQLIGIYDPIRMESVPFSGRYEIPLYRQRDWRIVQGPVYNTLLFTSPPPSARQLLIDGLVTPAVPTLATDQVEVDSEYLATAVALRAIESDAFPTKEQAGKVTLLAAQEKTLRQRHRSLVGRPGLVTFPKPFSSAAPSPTIMARAESWADFIADVLALAGDVRALWLPLQTESTTSTDRSRNARVLTYDGDASARYSQLGFGLGVSFNGTGNYATAPDANDLSFGDSLVDAPFSIATWVNLGSIAAAQDLLSKYDSTGGATNREFRFYLDATGKLNAELWDESAAAKIGRKYNTALTINSWYMLVLTYDGSGVEAGVRLYVNGTQRDDTANSAGVYVAIENLTSPLVLGAYKSAAAAYTNFLNGKAAATLLIARKLSIDDIAALKAAGNDYFGLAL